MIFRLWRGEAEVGEEAGDPDPEVLSGLLIHKKEKDLTTTVYPHIGTVLRHQTSYQTETEVL